MRLLHRATCTMAEVPLPTPTQVPVPSTDIRNAVFAGAKLDEEVTGSGEYYTDRLGVNRLTNTGRNNQFNSAQVDRANRFEQFLLSSGYVFLGDYEDGPFQFSARNQYIRYDNQYYRLNAETDVGYTTTGTDATSFANDVMHFVLMDGDSLRQNLASRLKYFGGWLSGYARNKITSTIKTVSQMLDASPIYVWEFADLITEKPDLSNPETWDWTPSILAAVAQSKANNFEPVMLPAGKVIISDTIVLTSSTRDYSGGSTSDGIKYKGVQLVGYGDGVTRVLFKPASSTSICISLVGNGGGHKTDAGVSALSIEPHDSTYSLMGYGVCLNCVNYAKIEDVSVYMLNENYRLLNGISNGWTEYNKFTRCFSYRGNVCYSFVRTNGNDSFHGNQFTDCFGQIKRSGGIGILGQGVSSSALVWVYNCKLDIKWYGGEAACKAISLTFAEMTMNHGDMTCEGTVTMETLDDYSRCQHRGRWLNNGTTLFSVVSERAGAQGRFTFQNLHSRTGSFIDSNISDYTPGVIPVTPDTYNNNGVGLFYMLGTNFASPMQTCQNYAGNGFYLGQIPLNGSVTDVTPSWKWSNDGGIMKSYNAAGMRFQIGSAETVRLTSTAFYPFNDNGMTMGLAANRYSNSYVSRRMYTATTGDLFGNGSPEGSVTAGVGSTYRRLDGGTSSSFYVKETGKGNTGWIAK